MNRPHAPTRSALRPEQLAPIRNLNLRARLIVEGAIAGMHRSPYHGFSAEFLEYRAYNRGESARFIDWRAYARSDRPFVRLFEDETNLSAHLMLDKSASMLFSSGGAMSKLDYARTLCAALAWILVRQRDAVGLAAFDRTVRSFLPPRSTRVHLTALLAALDGVQGSDETGCGAAIDWLAQRLRKRGMCVIVSDLLDEPERIVRGLRHLRFKRQDVIVLWVLDPLERDFEHDRPLRIRDLETGRQVLLDPSVAARGFRSGMAAHRRRLETVCADLGVDFEPVCTDEPFQRALLRVLGKRGRLG